MICRLGAHTLSEVVVTKALVAIVSGESELYALVGAAIEVQYMANLLEFVGHHGEQGLESDSSAARGFVQRQGVGRRLKHVVTNNLFVQQRVADGTVKVVPVKGTENLADIGTKYATKQVLDKLVKILGGVWLAENAEIASAYEMSMTGTMRVPGTH